MDQPHQGADAVDAALVGQFLGPLRARCAHLLSSRQPILQLRLNRAITSAQTAGLSELTRL